MVRSEIFLSLFETMQDLRSAGIMSDNDFHAFMQSQLDNTDKLIFDIVKQIDNNLYKEWVDKFENGDQVIIDKMQNIISLIEQHITGIEGGF